MIGMGSEEIVQFIPCVRIVASSGLWVLAGKEC